MQRIENPQLRAEVEKHWAYPGWESAKKGTPHGKPDWRHAYLHTAQKLFDQYLDQWHHDHGGGFQAPTHKLMSLAYRESARRTERAIRQWNENRK